MKAFVTGGSGFVGGHLLSHLSDNGDKILSPKPSDMDIRDYQSVKDVISDFQPDVIYHLAGIAFVPDCEENFANALSVNVLGTENVLKAARELAPESKFILISSGDLYGKVALENLPSKETDQPIPANNYSLSKIFAEKMAERAAAIYGQKTVIMRPFNHIGPWQSSRFAISSFAQQLAVMKRDKKTSPLKVGNLSAKRDLTDVRDIVRGYRLAALKGNGIYNLCSGISVTIREALDKLIEISGLDVKVEIDESRLRPIEIEEVRGSNKKAQQELGWQPQISLEQSLRDCLEAHEMQLSKS